MFSTLDGTYFSSKKHFKMLSAIRFNLDQSKILSFGNGLKKKKVQGEMTPKPRGVDTSKSHLTKLQYMINVCAKFQYNCSKTEGGICDTKLILFYTQID